MSFSDYLSSRLTSVKAGSELEEVVDAVYREREKDYSLKPSKHVVGTRELTHALTTLSDMFRYGRQRFELYKVISDSTISELNEEFGHFTEAVLNYEPGANRDSLGDQLHEDLSSWLSERAAHLDNIHRRARSTFEGLQGTDADDYLVFRFEHLKGDPSTNEAVAIPTEDIPHRIVPSQDSRTPTKYLGAEERRRDRMDFPTEEQAYEYLQWKKLTNMSVGEQQRIREAVGKGDLRITSENHSVFNQANGYDPSNPSPKLISRTKQGQVGRVAAEPLKLWASMCGERDSYSYDSIALWAANMEPAHNIRFLLGLAHGNLATAGNGTTSHDEVSCSEDFYGAASYIREGFRVLRQNDTPGGPDDFHRVAARIARERDEYESLRQIAQVRPPAHQKESKRRLTYEWAVGDRDAVPDQLASLYDETLDHLVTAYDHYKDSEAARRDADIVENGARSDYDFTDTVVGWKGEVIAQFRAASDRSKAGSVNVPFECMISDEPPYRLGAGWYSDNLDSDAPGVHAGNHASYKDGQLGELERLEKQGLLASVELLADYFPTLSV